MAASILSIFESLIAHARSWALTEDKSWFNFSYDYEGKWILVRDSSMTEPKNLIDTPNIIVLVIWGVDGLALVEIVPSNLLIKAKCLCEFAILHMEVNLKTHGPKQGFKDITFHWNNASSHTPNVRIDKISELGMNQMPHSAYSRAITFFVTPFPRAREISQLISSSIYLLSCTSCALNGLLSII
jgi:hypothetical protein